jgi:hypothetical protein
MLLIFIQELFKSCQRLVSLVDDFLTVSWIERGKIQFDFISVDLKSRKRFKLFVEYLRNTGDATFFIKLPEGA